MKFLRELLSAAGVEVANNNDADDEAALTVAMESWLGLACSVVDGTATTEDGTDDNNDVTMMTTIASVEDCLPLSDAVYEAAVDWLVDALSGSDRTMVVSNPLLLVERPRHGTTDDDATLERAFDSVRATKWVRAWMDFNWTMTVTTTTAAGCIVLMVAVRRPHRR
jgi:hypothetical protein